MTVLSLGSGALRQRRTAWVSKGRVVCKSAMSAIFAASRAGSVWAEEGPMGYRFRRVIGASLGNRRQFKAQPRTKRNQGGTHKISPGIASDHQELVTPETLPSTVLHCASRLLCESDVLC